jgi:hypothetical protein
MNDNGNGGDDEDDDDDDDDILILCSCGFSLVLHNHQFQSTAVSLHLGSCNKSLINRIYRVFQKELYNLERGWEISRLRNFQ